MTDTGIILTNRLILHILDTSVGVGDLVVAVASVRAVRYGHAGDLIAALLRAHQDNFVYRRLYHFLAKRIMEEC